ncbi:hypothetical protein C7C56_017055 [Massilia glaciei]|uniref:Uncharacterized protein n=1 Tax=Massilia glaciei TaxID=1524097 RepID=A0A2U2HHY6_9BURK|nr:hypothetical protein C7C56_017055 [Massilia glaciei]
MAVFDTPVRTHGLSQLRRLGRRAVDVHPAAIGGIAPQLDGLCWPGLIVLHAKHIAGGNILPQRASAWACDSLAVDTLSAPIAREVLCSPD